MSQVDDGLSYTQKLLVDNSPFMWYAPYPYEVQFHASPARFRWVFGGNRSGKSFSRAMDDIWFALGGDWHPWRKRGDNAVEIWVVGMDFPTLRDVVEPMYRRLLGTYWIKKWYSADHICVLKNGSQITFKSVESGWQKFASKAVNRVSIDEHITYDIWDELQPRIVDYKGDIICSMTPTEGMSWEFDIVYEPWLAGELPDTECFFYKTKDNLSLPPEEIQRLANSYKDDDTRAMRMEGKFIQMAGLVYKVFDRRVHVISPFKIPADYTRVRAIDPGINNPTACMWLAVDYDDNYYVYDEYYESDKTVGENARHIRAITLNETKASRGRIFYTLIDPHAGAKRNEETLQTVWQLYMNAGIPCRFGSDDIDARINLVNQKLWINPKTQKPQLYIFNTCKNTIWEMSRYIYDPQKRHAEDKNAKERPRKFADHLMNCLEYLCASKPRYLKGGYEDDLMSDGMVYHIDSSVKHPRQRILEAAVN